MFYERIIYSTFWHSVPYMTSCFLPSGFASAAAAMRPTTAQMRSQRNDVFSREQARQRSLYPRVEKIEVSMQGPGLDGTLLIMNKGMSTPLSCARREWRGKKKNSCIIILCTLASDE